jgi:hypothetical protein
MFCSPGLEILLSIVVLVPALLLIVYVVLDLIHNKIHITRLAWLFPAAPTTSSKEAAKSLAADPAALPSPASPEGAVSHPPSSPASAPAAADGEQEGDDGIEMQWAHAMPPQA